MKRVFSVLLLALLCVALTSCTVVKDSPEPLYDFDAIKKGPRTPLYSNAVGAITYTFYSDDTAEAVEVDKELLSESLVIPDEVEGFRVIAIADELFSGCDLKSVTLPKGLIKMGRGVFRGSGIASIRLPDSLSEMGESCFESCVFLKEFTLSSALKRIPAATFFSCGALESAVIPEGVEIVGEEAFAECTSLRKISLPSTLKEVEAYAFWHSGTDSLSFSLPESLSAVGVDAFAETAWLKGMEGPFVIVGDGVLLRYLGGDETVTVPEGVKYLSNAFDKTPLEELILPDSVTGMAEGALENATVGRVTVGEESPLKGAFSTEN